MNSYRLIAFVVCALFAIVGFALDDIVPASILGAMAAYLFSGLR